VGLELDLSEDGSQLVGHELDVLRVGPEGVFGHQEHSPEDVLLALVVAAPEEDGDRGQVAVRELQDDVLEAELVLGEEDLVDRVELRLREPIGLGVEDALAGCVVELGHQQVLYHRL
jgi:hypothetical protein